MASMEPGPKLNEIEFKDLRAQVEWALEALSDLEYQKRAWEKYDEGAPHRQDSVSLNVHVLYDNSTVLPDPKGSVGTVLYQDEVGPLERLDAVLGPIIDDLKASSSETYLNDPRWPGVVAAAGEALARMRAHE